MAPLPRLRQWGRPNSRPCKKGLRTSAKPVEAGHSCGVDLEHQVSELVDRVTALEEALAVAARTPAASAPPVDEAPTTVPIPAPLPPPPVASNPPPPPPLSPPPPVEAEPNPPQESRFVANVGIESVLRWAGVALVTLAALFFISTAITRGWIGPELQLLAAAIAGGTMHAGADRLEKSRRPWALALGCGGAIVLPICAVATHEWLDVVGPGFAIALTGVAVVACVAVAFKTRLEGIALVAGLVAIFAPLDSLDTYGDGAILGWVAGFVLASSLIGWVRAWPGERLITGWLGAVLLMVYALSEDPTGGLRVAGFVGAAIVAAVLWLGPTLAGHLGHRVPLLWKSFDWTPLDYRLVGFVPSWVAAVVVGLLSLDGRQENGAIALVVAAGFLFVAQVTIDRVDRLVTISTVFGSLTLFAMGLALVLDGPALMVALAIQAAGTYYLAHLFGDRPLRFGSYALGSVATLLAAGEMFKALDNNGFANAGAIFATAVVVLGWVIVAVALRGSEAIAEGDGLVVVDQRAAEVPFELAFFGAWSLAILWTAATLVGAPQGMMLISIAWASMVGIGLTVGLRGNNGLLKNAALGTLVLTLGKLFTVDLAEVDVFWRVGLFLLIGSGLITLGLKVPTLIGAGKS